MDDVRILGHNYNSYLHARLKIRQCGDMKSDEHRMIEKSLMYLYNTIGQFEADNEVVMYVLRYSRDMSYCMSNVTEMDVQLSDMLHRL